MVRWDEYFLFFSFKKFVKLNVWKFGEDIYMCVWFLGFFNKNWVRWYIFITLGFCLKKFKIFLWECMYHNLVTLHIHIKVLKLGEMECIFIILDFCFTKFGWEYMYQNLRKLHIYTYKSVTYFSIKKRVGNFKKSEDDKIITN